MALQKARHKERRKLLQRSILRLWMTPIRYKGKEVWIGAVSRDIGSYLTGKKQLLLEQTLDPSMDESRAYVMEDLAFSGGVKKFGFVGGVEPAPRYAPHRNFLEQTWWTDGKRAVLQFHDEPRTLSEIDFFLWEWPRGEDSEEINKALRLIMEKSTSEAN